ncbi:mandelate racemase/muconate lactonizing enzyme family protein [Leucobacter sp. GX0328]
MRIEHVETWILRVPFIRTSADFDGAHHELIGVTVHAEGLTGMGYSFITDTAGGTAVKALLDDLLVPRIIGRSPVEVERIWHELDHLTHRMGTGINRFAMASIDIALWDLRAKLHGNSLAQELGQLTDTVPVYGSGKAGNRLALEELVELSAGYLDEGFDAVKIRVGLEPEHDRARVAAVRSALGDGARIMIDANERLDCPTALSLGRSLADLDIFWFEEPVHSRDLESHVFLSRHLPMSITGGEHHCSAAEFQPYISRRAFGIVQPNVCMVGGVTEIMRIARAAELGGVGFAPHLMTDLNVHISAATMSTSYVEYFPFLEPYTTNRLTISEGRAEVPTTPGHGIEFTEETFERYRIA